MKRAVATFILVLVSSVALALPAPKDIEAAVKSGQLSQAETMLHEVIKEKPNSAKAHYELGQVLAREGRNHEARQELLEAQRIDPSLKFATDPQRFRDLLNRVPATGAPTLSVPPAPAVNHVSPAAPAGSSFPWVYVLLGGGVLLVIWLVVSRASTAARGPVGSVGGGTAVAGGGGYGYGPAGYGAPPQNAGSGIGGAVLGGIAGMAAGYGLAKVLEHGEDNRPAQHVANDNGFIPIDSGAQPDYGNFDAGSGGDSWDAGDSSADDNNW